MQNASTNAETAQQDVPDPAPALSDKGQACDRNQVRGGDKARQRRMSILAHASPKALAEGWGRLGIDPRCEMLRGPETGLVALRGRIGGGGAPFNFGEATVTRATVRLENGAVGHAMTLGRNKTKARLAAVIDALAEDGAMAGRIEADILTPLEDAQTARDEKRHEETQATKVNFFTMVRGED